VFVTVSQSHSSLTLRVREELAKLSVSYCLALWVGSKGYMEDLGLNGDDKRTSFVNYSCKKVYCKGPRVHLMRILTGVLTIR